MVLTLSGAAIVTSVPKVSYDLQVRVWHTVPLFNYDKNLMEL